MAKNVVVCCDGTANEFAKNNTNVVKLYAMLEHDSATQVTFYHPGIGTMEPAGTLSTFSRKWTKLLGMAIGYGLCNDIRDAYVFIMQNYEPGDRLFLFGFSRGAYTVRAAAALLRMYGLIRPGNEPLVPYAIRMMMGIDRSDKNDKEHQEAVAQYFELADEFKETLSVPCKPHFVGVWDTVSSVGWVENPLRLPYVANNPDIQIGRHAVAIDERRAFFRTNLWRRPADSTKPWGPQDVKQVWFAGVHCDVGGGYPEMESGLSKIALEWMVENAKQAGLLVNRAKQQEIIPAIDTEKYVAPNPKAELHGSLKGWWNLAEFVLKRHYNWASGKEGRRMNLYRRRTIPAGSLIHDSVRRRGGNYASRIPANVTYVGTP